MFAYKPTAASNVYISRCSALPLCMHGYSIYEPPTRKRSLHFAARARYTYVDGRRAELHEHGINVRLSLRTRPFRVPTDPSAHLPPFSWSKTAPAPPSSHPALSLSLSLLLILPPPPFILLFSSLSGVKQSCCENDDGRERE